MTGVFLGIGSNLGDAVARVYSAIDAIGQLENVRLLRSASLYGSKPFGPVPQGDFVNTVIEIETVLPPRQLLQRLKQLERELGRAHGERWGPREIDIDILLFGDLQWQSADLSLPHPGIGERAFVLAPLAELMPAFELPSGKTAATALADMPPGLVWLLPDDTLSAFPGSGH